jgi:hypothetical protein
MVGLAGREAVGEGGGGLEKACNRGDCICTEGKLKGQFHEIDASRKMSKHFWFFL